MNNKSNINNKSTIIKIVNIIANLVSVTLGMSGINKSVQYLLYSKNNRPWILKGTVNGKNSQIITQDPKNENSITLYRSCLLYTSPSPRDAHESRMPSSA